MSGRRICRIALVLLPWAGAADAGAWPRAVNGVFLSVTTEHDRNGSSHTGLYAEYGLSPRNTLGFQLDHTTVGETGALMWLQRSMDDGSGRDRWSLTMGLGWIERDDAMVPQGLVGAAWGRGVQGLFDGGWVSVDTRLQIAGTIDDERVAAPGAGYLDYITPELSAKAEVTLGLHLSPATMVINQLRLEEREDTGFSAGLASSVVRDMAGVAKLELGLVTPISGSGEQSVRIGTWLEF